MTEPGGPSPVTEAAQWLARQGIDVSSCGPTPAPTSTVRPPASTSRPGRRRATGGSAGHGSDDRDDAGSDPPDEAEADPYAVAQSIALRKLTARDRTRHELAEALASRDVPAEVAEEVLDRLEAVGLVDDAAFADAWVESRQQRRHLSRTALRRELRAKGVGSEEIAAALQPVEAADEVQAARTLAERRHTGMTALPYEVRYRRLAGLLGRRGFGPAVIAPVLRDVLGGPAEDDRLP